MKDQEKFTNLCSNDDEPLLRFLHQVIRWAVRVLSVLMVMVIIWGVLDIIWVIYRRIMQPPYGLLRLNDILFTFGAFLAVLIAIEIFLNITLYLRDRYAVHWWFRKKPSVLYKYCVRNLSDFGLLHQTLLKFG